MSAFTPGPWKLRTHSDGWLVSGGDNDLYSVADVVNANGYPQNEANARLIAASPLMYEAIDCAVIDLDLLLMAINADDPKRELLIRVTDIKRRLSTALSKVKG